MGILPGYLYQLNAPTMIESPKELNYVKINEYMLSSGEELTIVPPAQSGDFREYIIFNKAPETNVELRMVELSVTPRPPASFFLEYKDLYTSVDNGGNSSTVTAKCSSENECTIVVTIRAKNPIADF